MAPNITSQTLLIAADTNNVLNGGKNIENCSKVSSSPEENRSNRDGHEDEEHYEWNICWRNVLAFLYLHVTAVYGLFLLLTGHVMLYTFVWNISLGIFAALGVTAGAHRLWAHKAYSARWPLRVILALLQAMAFQNHIYEWVRDHRVHHKFTDTNADPHNAKRGFFFSHIGWLMVKKHPDVKIKGATVDMSDMTRDWVVMWQKRTYFFLMPFMCFIMPTIVPIFVWNEENWTAWYSTIFRYTLGLNFTWLVNSAAHIWGTKPYDKDISPMENKTVGVIALGEGWHNYHHVFPWDYKAAELGNYSVNLTTGFIDFFAKIGWAYNLRTVSYEAIRKRANRTGDGSLTEPDDYNHHMNVWGWGDADMSNKAKMAVDVSHAKHSD
ncbi:UNVERIFIED_CONTAM: hypothetical protein PYX00_002838 [Menopon gallinae]|uniref:Fatty acid desaturase domain-containing protein n=1 Tax=Menopon gallinae TaxID=328185 RepID=A0AAW2HY87_9NEOP